MKWTLVVKNDDVSANLLRILNQENPILLRSVLKEVKIQKRFLSEPYIKNKKKKIVGAKKILNILIYKNKVRTPHKQPRPQSQQTFNYDNTIRNMLENSEGEDDGYNEKLYKEEYSKKIAEMQERRDRRSDVKQSSLEDIKKEEQLNINNPLESEDNIDDYFEKIMKGSGD